MSNKNQSDKEEKLNSNSKVTSNNYITNIKDNEDTKINAIDNNKNANIKETKKRPKKYNDINDLPEDLKNKLQDYRIKEKQYLMESGYLIWKKLLLGSYLAYSIIFYYTFIKRQNFISTRHLFFMFFPVFPLGHILFKYNVDINKYRLYINTHSELNKLIQKHIYKKDFQ